MNFYALIIGQILNIVKIFSYKYSSRLHIW